MAPATASRFESAWLCGFGLCRRPSSGGVSLDLRAVSETGLRARHACAGVPAFPIRAGRPGRNAVFVGAHSGAHVGALSAGAPGGVLPGGLLISRNCAGFMGILLRGLCRGRNVASRDALGVSARSHRALVGRGVVPARVRRCGGRSGCHCARRRSRAGSSGGVCGRS